MIGTFSPLVLQVRVFAGRGSRLNRVHIFDGRTGSYVTSGFTRDCTLFVRKPIDLASVTIREFDRRESAATRLAAPTRPSAARRSDRLQRGRRASTPTGTLVLLGGETP